MGITKSSMNTVIWDQFGVMRQERLLPEQQEVLHNKSQQNTRWKLIASYFVINACCTKWKQLPRSLVCMRTSVDVFHNLYDLMKYFYPRTRWILTGLTGECVRALLILASFPPEVWSCCFFFPRRMSYISATIVLGFLLAAILLSLPYTHISLPITCWLDMWIWITGSQFTESSGSILLLSFLIKRKNRLYGNNININANEKKS